jgi:hypothetical protein
MLTGVVSPVVAQAPPDQITRLTSAVFLYEKPEPQPKPEKWSPEWFKQLPVPADEYWDKVAQCETASNWQDKGRWAGGLGIFDKTWLAWGGGEFAPHPSLASRRHQIIVANRIAIRGWTRPSGKFRYPAGYRGWGCIRNREYLDPPVKDAWGKGV